MSPLLLHVELIAAQIGGAEGGEAFRASQARLFLCGRLLKLDTALCSHLVSHRHNAAITIKFVLWPKFASSIIAQGLHPVAAPAPHILSAPPNFVPHLQLSKRIPKPLSRFRVTGFRGTEVVDTMSKGLRTEVFANTYSVTGCVSPHKSLGSINAHRSHTR